MTTPLPTMISSAEFIKKIEEIVAGNRADYIDAVVDYCLKNGIEVETAASMIKSSPSMKSKIQTEAEDLNILPRVARLPVD